MKFFSEDHKKDEKRQKLMGFNLWLIRKFTDFY